MEPDFSNLKYFKRSEFVCSSGNDRADMDQSSFIRWANSRKAGTTDGYIKRLPIG